MFNKYCLSLVLAVSMLILKSAAVQAQDSTLATIQVQSRPIQIAIFTPIQILPETDFIEGFRFNLIYGRNTSVTGFDFGFVNQTTRGMSRGLQFGFVNMVDPDFTGWQCGFLNRTKENFEGFQLGMVNYAKHLKGVQFGLVNWVGNLHGLQIGLVNINDEGGEYPVLPIVHWSF